MKEYRPTTLSLLEDLEAIQKSLKKVAETSIEIPTLDEVIENTPTNSINPDNPFLSGDSLSELIRVRNEAEARAARDLAKLGRIKPIDEILTLTDEAEQNQEPSGPQAPDPEEIIEKMEGLFQTWVEHSVKQYLTIFENELRNHLQQDFRQLVTQWYSEHELPLPEKFESREAPLEENQAKSEDNDLPSDS